jgi:hypothetical protein
MMKRILGFYLRFGSPLIHRTCLCIASCLRPSGSFNVGVLVSRPGESYPELLTKPQLYLSGAIFKNPQVLPRRPLRQTLISM